MEKILSIRHAIEETLDMVLFNAIPEPAMILSPHRQIVAYNQSLQELLNITDEFALIGARPGELFHCIHSVEGIGGCGTSAKCAECDALGIFLQAADGQMNENNAGLLTSDNHGLVALDLSVKAVPHIVKGETCLIVFMKDVSEINRKRNMERLFLHDTMNIVSGLSGLAEIMRDFTVEETKKWIPLLAERVDYLVHEIESYKKLSLAERGELHTQFEEIPVLGLLRSAAGFFNGAGFAEGKEVLIYADCVDEATVVTTDKFLLFRVVLNLLRNALEASQKGDIVKLKAECRGGAFTLSVYNSQHIPPSVASHIFYRTFSTKNMNRGIGTYSAKLFAENYLGGHLDFETSEQDGTRFILSLEDKPF